ncbi:phospholipase D family protein [Saccharopolyspora sp. CA-218241]|uniref:phospholipase D family protein n=1 Tax=Saccharopolyspora sp. CA-218241 TaxID=3240027 RepID=UPI003D959023
MDHDQQDVTDWLLTPAERGNPHTGLDGATAWSGGNRVRPLIDGAEYFDRLRAELADTGPGDRIHLAAWLGDPDQPLDASGRTAGAALVGAVRAGASVHALLWRPYLDVLDDFAPGNLDLAALLRREGATAVLDQRVRATGSHHQKFLVIRRPDRPADDVAFVGGIDPSPSRRDDGGHRGDPRVQSSVAAVYGHRPSWHDAHLEVRGPAVADVEHCFRERWQDSTSLRRAPASWWHREEHPTALPEPLPAPPRCGPHAVQLLRTYPAKTPPFPFAPDGERSVAHGYRKALRRARRFVYVEDQFLWSPMVAEVFAEALRRRPHLRLVAVLPRRPDKDGALHVATSDVAHADAVDLLHRAGGDRVHLFELESDAGPPIYVHSKLCVVDDVWAAVGSANLNRRSWTYDSELTAAVVDEPGGSFARDLRVRLWREHLGGRPDTEPDPPERGIALLREAAAALDRWHAAGRRGPRPPGHLRTHRRPRVTRRTRLWAVPAGRLLTDPDGRAWSPRRRGAAALDRLDD